MSVPLPNLIVYDIRFGSVRAEQFPGPVALIGENICRERANDELLVILHAAFEVDADNPSCARSAVY